MTTTHTRKPKKRKKRYTPPTPATMKPTPEQIRAAKKSGVGVLTFGKRRLVLRGLGGFGRWLARVWWKLFYAWRVPKRDDASAPILVRCVTCRHTLDKPCKPGMPAHTIKWPEDVPHPHYVAGQLVQVPRVKGERRVELA